MATSRTVPVKGTRFYIATGFGEDKTVTNLGAAKPATVTASGLNAKKGDVIRIAGADGFNGEYVVASVDDDTYTLAHTDWSEETPPSVFDEVKVAKAAFGKNFCNVKSFNRAGGSFQQEEVTDLCSDGVEYENGLYDGGTLDLQFNYQPHTDVQQQLATYERSGERFWTKWVLPKSGNKGAVLLHNVLMQTGTSIEGAMSGGSTRYQSSLSLKVNGHPYSILD